MFENLNTATTHELTVLVSYITGKVLDSDEALKILRQIEGCKQLRGKHYYQVDVNNFFDFFDNHPKYGTGMINMGLAGKNPSEIYGTLLNYALEDEFGPLYRY